MEYELQTDDINLSVSLQFILSSANSRAVKIFNGGGGGGTAKSFTGGALPRVLVGGTGESNTCEG